MELQLLKGKFCICKLQSVSQVDMSIDFYFLAKTDCEISLVCAEHDAPKNAKVTDMGWNCLRVVGTLDFSLVGILSQISKVLAKSNIPVFVVSTYDTDYILVKDIYVDKAIVALKESGYTVI